MTRKSYEHLVSVNEDSTCLIIDQDESNLSSIVVAQNEQYSNFNDNFGQALLKAREAFSRNITKSPQFRAGQLKNLRKCIDEHYDEFVDGLKADFRKPRLETVVTEMEFIKNDIKFQLDNMHKYTKPVHVKKGVATMFDDCYVNYDPYGVVLIFGAWNYPLQVLLCPLVGAIAAGNCALIKPSEVASNTEKLLAKLLPQYLDNDCYHVICGGPDEASRLLNERFDLVFFTGSSSIGKLVYNAASKFLTPCVLELGGKSPVYIDDTVSNFETAVKRILWAKLLNAGQTCIAPDYILCSADVQDKFVNVAAKVLKDFYDSDIQKSDSFSRIINTKNFDRLNSMLTATKGKVVIGGQTDREENYIAPTIISNVSSADSMMKDEIFGPICPIVTVDSVDEAIQFIKRGEKPLTLYIYSNKSAVVKRFISETSSGSVCVNDSLMQATVDTLPFGGVGNSGIGKYHGLYSFETFSHSKSVMVRDYNPVIEYLASARYPPYSESKLRRLTLLTTPTFLDKIEYGKIFSYLFFFLLGIGAMFAANFLK